MDAEKRVTVTIDPYDYLYAYSKQDSDIIWFAGRILVEKYQPDRPPRMMPNVNRVVMLPAELYRQTMQYAARREVSWNDAIRLLVEQALGEDENENS